MMKHLDPGRRHVDLLAELLEQRLTGVAFEKLDLRGDRGLREMQLMRRPREAQMPRHAFENLELAQCRILHRPPRQASITSDQL